MKIEIDEKKVNSFNKEELKEHLSLVDKSIKLLNSHAHNVKERIFNLEVGETEAKWPLNVGKKVKVTYRDWNGEKEVVGFFSHFGRAATYVWARDSVYCVLRTAKKDGSMGKRAEQILANAIKKIEPCE